MTQGERRIGELREQALNLISDTYFSREEVERYFYDDESGRDLNRAEFEAALISGLEEYLSAVAGHRFSMSWEIDPDRVFVQAGGSSYGDDPYEGWTDLVRFVEWLDSENGLKKMIELLGFVGGGIVIR